MRILFRSVLFAAALAAGISASAGAQETHVGKLTGNEKSGSHEFPRYCDGCHGARGDGKGTFAPFLDPRPRDYTMGVFKCRSTPTGTLPTDEDLYNTMTRGIVTAAMPSWASLTPQTRVDIIAYLKHFSPRFRNEKPGTPITIPEESPVTIESIRRGAGLYKKLECVDCHGAKGHGDGPKAPTLYDIKHNLLPPYDFSVTMRFKCGVTNRDLYRTLMTGMDGSPMVSYADRLTPDETWDVIHYVRTLEVDHKSPENRVLAASGEGKVLAPSKP